MMTQRWGTTDKTPIQPKKRPKKSPQQQGGVQGAAAHLPEHVDLLDERVASLHALHHVVQPARALAARRALPAALVLVKVAESRDCIDDVGALVHHNHRRCSEATLQRAGPFRDMCMYRNVFK